MGDPPGLAEELRGTLARLSGTPELKHFYLVGGAVFGLRVGQERSNDLVTRWQQLPR
jgi:hypothetical protein